MLGHFGEVNPKSSGLYKRIKSHKMNLAIRFHLSLQSPNSGNSLLLACHIYEVPQATA